MVPDTFSVRRGRRRKQWMLLAASLLLVFGVLEAVFRIAAAVQDARTARKVAAGETWLDYDPEIGFRPRIGPDGMPMFKSPVIGRKLRERTRVLMLGDSIAFWGNGPNDTLVAHASEALNRAGRRCEWTDAAVPAYTTYQELLLLKKFGVQLDPDVVGLCFCMNDLHKTLVVPQTHAGQLIRINEIEPDKVALVHGRLWRLANGSMFLRWARGRIASLAYQAGIELRSGYSFTQQPGLAAAWQDEPWDNFSTWLSEMAAVCAPRGARLFVVGCPLPSQYNARYLSRDRDFVLKPQRKLAEVCARLNIPLLDLHAVLTASDFEDGLHPNDGGRRKIGQAIAGFCREQGLVR